MLAIQRVPPASNMISIKSYRRHACIFTNIVVVAFPVTSTPSLAMPVKSEQPAPVGSSGGPAAKASTGRRKISDFRLAEQLEDCRFVRDLLRHSGRLIQWANDDLVNVITLEALGLNYRLMVIVAQFHCSKTNLVNPPAINFLKAQA